MFYSHSIFEFKKGERVIEKQWRREKVIVCLHSRNKEGRCWCQQVPFDERSSIYIFLIPYITGKHRLRLEKSFHFELIFVFLTNYVLFLRLNMSLLRFYMVFLRYLQVEKKVENEFFRPRG